MELNSRIRKLIDARESNSFYGDIKESIKDYSECLDYFIQETDLKVGLKRLYQYAEINEFSKDKSCIITNSVNGKIASHLYDNIHIYCFDNDYYCSMVSQIVNQEKNKIDKIEFIFSDISQFFTFKNNKNFIADFVITCANSNQNTFKDLDYEMKYRMLNPYEYYTLRSLDFIQVGGIVLSIVPTLKVDGVISQAMNYESPIRVLDKINFMGYSFIYLKKV